MLNTHTYIYAHPPSRKIPYNKRNIQKRKLHIHLKELCTHITHTYVLLNTEQKKRNIKKECCALLPLLCIGGNLMNICRMNVETPKKQQKMYNKGGRMNKKKTKNY